MGVVVVEDIICIWKINVGLDVENILREDGIDNLYTQKLVVVVVVVAVVVAATGGKVDKKDLVFVKEWKYKIVL